MTTSTSEEQPAVSAPVQMFERVSDLSIVRCSVAMSHSNLSIVFAELRNTTYAAVSDVSQVDKFITGQMKGSRSQSWSWTLKWKQTIGIPWQLRTAK